MSDSEKQQPRRPRVFKVETSTPEDRTHSASPSDRAGAPPPAVAAPPKAFASDQFEEETIADDIAEPELQLGRRAGFSWIAVILTALFGLITLVAGLYLERLIRSLLTEIPVLGWAAVALTALLVIGILGLVLKELLALRRLSRIGKYRAHAENALARDDRAAAATFAHDLSAFYHKRADLARGRANLIAHQDDIMDTQGRLTLTETELLRPLDAQARELISDASKRVSLVTAISPRAVFDVLFVLFATVRLISALAKLYGARPGTIASLQLLRAVFGHLLVTGGLAATESLVEQFVGQGLAARLSARLGEGVVNGVLTARIGVSAVASLRPMPFIEAEPVRVRDVIRSLHTLADQRAEK